MKQKSEFTWEPEFAWRKTRGVKNISPAIFPFGVPAANRGEEIVARFAISEDEVDLPLSDLERRYPCPELRSDGQ